MAFTAFTNTSETFRQQKRQASLQKALKQFALAGLGLGLYYAIKPQLNPLTALNAALADFNLSIISWIIFAPILFLTLNAAWIFLAKLLKTKANFTEQAQVTSFAATTSAITLLITSPFGILNLIAWIYVFALFYVALRETHQFGRIKTIATLFIPVLLLNFITPHPATAATPQEKTPNQWSIFPDPIFLWDPRYYFTEVMIRSLYAPTPHPHYPEPAQYIAGQLKQFRHSEGTSDLVAFNLTAQETITPSQILESINPPMNMTANDLTFYCDNSCNETNAPIAVTKDRIKANRPTTISTMVCGAYWRTTRFCAQVSAQKDVQKYDLTYQCIVNCKLANV